MQIISINNQECLSLTEVAKALKLTKQRVCQLIKDRQIDKINIGSQTMAISLTDFVLLQHEKRATGRPYKINPENILK